MAVSTTIKEADKKKNNIKYEIIGYAEISVEDIEPNPHNPRPKFHTGDDDPNLVALGEAIKTQGQHHPGLVYEQVGHWSLPDRPGHYILLQGERRWRSCGIAGVGTYRAFIAKTPVSEAEEWDWLGIEEAFKLEWQPFFLLRYAYNLAKKHDVPVTHPEMAVKTGLGSKDLKIAEKLFALEPEIQAAVAEYEEFMYHQLSSGVRKKGTRLTGSGLRTKEFPVQKAALVWDIFEALRTNCTMMVRELSDLELQRLIASRATKNGSTLRDLEAFLGSVRAVGKNPPPGLLTQIADLIHNPERTIRQINENTGVTEYGKVQTFLSKAPRFRAQLDQLIRNVDQCGNDPTTLAAIESECMRLFSSAVQLEKTIREKREKLQRKAR